MGVSTQVFRALITADSSGAVQEYRKFNGEVQKSTAGATKQTGAMGMAFTRAKVAVAAVGTTAALALGRHAVNASKDLTESINAVNVMYGESSDAVLKLSEDAADSAGLSERAFNESAVAVGGFVAEIAAMSGQGAPAVLDELITRASDFASVFNIDVEEALQRFRSGLAGETEPLRRFGINLLQSEVNAYALAEGITEAGATMTESEKVMARYGLLLEKTDVFAGDFKNTSGELANQQRILKADAENLAAKFGDALVPAMQSGITALSGFLGLLETARVPEAFGYINIVLEEILGSTNGVTEALKEMAEVGGNNGMATTKKRLTEFAEAVHEIEQSAGWIGQIKRDLRDGVFDSSIVPEEGLRKFEDLKAVLEDMPLEDARAVVQDLRRQLQFEGVESDRFREIFGLTTESVNELADAYFNYESKRVPIGRGRKDVEDYNSAIGKLNFELDANSAINEGLAAVLRKKRKADQDAAEAAEEHAEAVAGLASEIDAILGIEFDYEKATMATAMAVLDLAEQEEETNAILRDGKATAADKTAALYDLRSAQIDSAEAALEQAEALAIEQGATTDSAAGQIIMRDELIRLREQFPQLRDEINRYIEELNRIPRDINTTVRLSGNRVGTTDSAGRVTSFSYSGGNSRIPLEARASGGPITAGRPYMVGEAGPEMVVPRTAGTVIPNHNLNGGSVININVNAGLGADGHDIGNVLVDVLKRHERSNGPGWRN